MLAEVGIKDLNLIDTNHNSGTGTFIVPFDSMPEKTPVIGFIFTIPIGYTSTDET
jgi:hypothetical protein